jgi:hypothetical protein
LQNQNRRSAQGQPEAIEAFCDDAVATIPNPSINALLTTLCRKPWQSPPDVIPERYFALQAQMEKALEI